VRSGRRQKLSNVCIADILGPLKRGYDRLLETSRDLADGDRGIGRELDCPGSGVDFGSSRFNSLHCYPRVNCPPPPHTHTHTLSYVLILRSEKHVGYSDCVKVFFAVGVHSVEDG